MKAELIDKMGSDLSVVNSARVSFNKESDWETIEESHYLSDGVWWPEKKGLNKSDQKLIQYLAKHNHWTPFSHVMITMRETVPIFVARQRFKHVVGFTYNEESRRYVSDEPTFFYPDVWRKAAENKKQGSTDEVVEKITMYDPVLGYGDVAWEPGQAADYLYTMAQCLYKSMIDGGVAPEQARMVLPQSMYTSYYVTGSLAAWARAYKLRSDPHAQREIQDLAAQWHKIISNIPEMKYSWGALIV